MYTESALCGSKSGCARTDTVFSPISEVSGRAVSLWCCMVYFTGVWCIIMVQCVPEGRMVYYSVIRCIEMLHGLLQ